MADTTVPGSWQGQLISAGIGAIPMIIDLIKSIHGVANPGSPPLTDTQLLQILADLGAASIAKDDAWLAAHKSG